MYSIKRKYRKFVTIIEGLDEKQLDLDKLAKILKSKLACGGTSKNGRIELQGNHKTRIKDVLAGMGFSPDMIDVR